MKDNNKMINNEKNSNLRESISGLESAVILFKGILDKDPLIFENTEVEFFLKKYMGNSEIKLIKSIYDGVLPIYKSKGD